MEETTIERRFGAYLMVALAALARFIMAMKPALDQGGTQVLRRIALIILVVCSWPLGQGVAPSRAANETLSALSADRAAVSAPYSWKMLVLLYRDIDATYIDLNGQTQHVVAHMSDADYAYIFSAIQNLPATINSWSNGATGMDVTIVPVPRPIAALARNGEVDEYSVQQEIDAYNPGGLYDSIAVAVISQQPGGTGGVATVGLSGRANGAGFSVNHFPVDFAAWHASYPEELIVHEWLHNVEGFYRDRGYNVPSLHAAESLGYQPDANGSWHVWYEDYMQNHVWNGSAYVGVPFEAWRNHKPTGVNVVTAPATPLLLDPLDAATNVSLNPSIRWLPSVGAQWYRVQLALDPGFTQITFDRFISATDYQVFGLTPGKTYFARASAVNKGGVSSWTSPHSFTTQSTAESWPGSALRFDGVDDHVRVRRMIGDDFTLEAWIRTTSSRAGWHAWEGLGLIYADVAATVNDFSTAVLNGRFAFSTGNPDITVQSTSVITTGQWVHVAAVRTRATGRLQVFVNGVEEASLYGASTAALTDPLYIDFGGNLLDLRSFDGLMDEVRIWNMARTPDQIKADMSRRLAGTESGLIGYWRFDEGSGTSALDASGHGYHGELRYGPGWASSNAPLWCVADRCYGVFLPVALNQAMDVRSESIANGGFEENAAWTFDNPPELGGYTTALAHSGQRSAKLGVLPTEPLMYGYAIASQPVTIPTNASSVALSFWYWPRYEAGSAPLGSNYQFAKVLDSYKNTLAVLFETSDDAAGWQRRSFNLAPYAGQTVYIVFGVFNDGNFHHRRAAMYVDDVSMMVEPGALQMAPRR